MFFHGEPAQEPTCSRAADEYPPVYEQALCQRKGLNLRHFQATTVCNLERVQHADNLLTISTFSHVEPACFIGGIPIAVLVEPSPSLF
jgi:hypothetical protein